MKTYSLILFVILMMAGCGGNERREAPGVAVPPPAPTREEVRNHIGLLTSKLGCTQDRDCENIGAGAFPCGGPREYIAFSLLHTDRAALEKELARLEEMDKKKIEEEGVSMCQAISRPLVKCVESTCRNLE